VGPITWVALETTESGMSRQLIEAAIMAEHLETGAVASYGITRQELHGDPRWTHITWYTVSDLETIDAVGRSLETGMNVDVDRDADGRRKSWLAISV